MALCVNYFVMKKGANVMALKQNPYKLVCPKCEEKMEKRSIDRLDSVIDSLFRK
jgi:hypothetical protein